MAILYSMEVKMTSLIEKVVAIIAPHRCISCGVEDNVLCDGCRFAGVPPLLPHCVLCARPAADWEICAACRPHSSLGRVWVGGAYDGLVAQVIQKYKFQRARAAHVPLARLMLDTLPYGDWQIAPIPTVAARIRQRGYDQAALLAKAIAVARGMSFASPLMRLQNSRQVGATRVQRQAQSTKMFSIHPTAHVQGAKILLVDDVCTTGATLDAAAHALREAGAREVSAIVAAWQLPSRG